MNKIYFIFECDPQRNYGSYCVKLATSNKRYAKQFFQENRFSYFDSYWSLNLAEYEPNMSDINGNLLKDLELLETTEKK